MTNKILVVDDEPISLTVIRHHLETADYTVVCTTSGKEAWQLLTNSPFDYGLVISDRVMPGVDGLELLQKMMQDTYLSKIPLVMTTGICEKEEMIEAIHAGAYDFLFKPIEKDLLLAVVNRALVSNSLPENS